MCLYFVPVANTNNDDVISHNWNRNFTCDKDDRASKDTVPQNSGKARLTEHYYDTTLL